MAIEKDIECRGILIGETDNAIRVAVESTRQAWWLPRSLVAYMRREAEGDKTRVIFTLPEWLIEEKDCWDLVP